MITMHNYLGAIRNWAKVLKRRSNVKTEHRELADEFKLSDDIEFCHKETVHIFIRGLADGKLHSAKNRVYSDVRFYKKDNLRVFCGTCRKRVI